MVASNQTIVLNSSGTASLSNTFTSNTVINIVSVTSSGTPSCTNTTPSSVTITVYHYQQRVYQYRQRRYVRMKVRQLPFTGTPNATVTYNINGGSNQTIVLNSSGTASLSNTFTSNTAINIVSVTSSGTPSCTNTTPSSVTINRFYHCQQVVYQYRQRRYVRMKATITFTGTPNATVKIQHQWRKQSNHRIEQFRHSNSLSNTFTSNTVINIALRVRAPVERNTTTE